MGFSIRTFLDNIRSLGAEPEQRSSNLVALEQFGDGLFSNTTKAGKPVTNDTALTLSAVWASIRLISETIAGLPFQVIEKTKDGRVLAGYHPLYNVLHRKPNGKMTSFNFRVAMMHHVLTGGNFFAWIHREDKESDTWIQVLDPSEIDITEDENAVYYKLKDGTIVQSYDMIHVKGFGDGVWGLSPISYAREAIGAGLSAQDYAGELMSNGITATGVVEMPGKMPTAEQLEDLKKQLGRQFRGGKQTNKDGIVVMYDGMKFNRIAIPPADAQFLEQRKFTVDEIARIFRIPPYLIGSLDRATFNTVEQMSLDFVQYSLLPWVKSIEQEFDSKIFKEADKSKFGVKLSVDGLLRGDFATRTGYYNAAISTGWLTRNEVRKLENFPPLKGGDEPLVPVNLTTMDKLTQDEEQGN